MRIQVGKDENQWVQLVGDWVHAQVQPRERVFVPAGGTPSALYRSWTSHPTEHLRSLQFVQIDDVLTGPSQRTFRRYFVQEMGPYQAQFEWIEDADHGAQVAILGVGVNGHVAFHEPGLPRDFYSGCVSLSSETLGYLNLGPATWGITYGVGSFLQCQKILVLARGERKREVLRRALSGAELPIAWILRHHDVTLIADFDL